MLKIEKFVTASPEQWEIIIEGMRNPMNSWGKMDSSVCRMDDKECYPNCPYNDNTCPVYNDEHAYIIGSNDHTLMMNLAKNGPVHAKYRRMIPVWVTLTAPLYWWKEFNTYKVGTVANSCSTMHKIQAKEFTRDDFSCERLLNKAETYNGYVSTSVLDCTIGALNEFRKLYLDTKNKTYWWQMIQLLPTSYNQKRTVMLNYEVLHNIYFSRKDHKLDEWHTFCDWIEELPYSEIVIGERD